MQPIPISSSSSFKDQVVLQLYARISCFHPPELRPRLLPSHAPLFTAFATLVPFCGFVQHLVSFLFSACLQRPTVVNLFLLFFFLFFLPVLFEVPALFALCPRLSPAHGLLTVRSGQLWTQRPQQTLSFPPVTPSTLPLSCTLREGLALRKGLDRKSVV